MAKYLSAYDEHLSHRWLIGMKELQDLEVKILDMGTDPGLRERVWDVYNSVLATFMGTSAYKIFENQFGDCLARISVQVQVAVPVAAQPPGVPAPPTSAPA